jgi:hypothetical protein
MTPVTLPTPDPANDPESLKGHLHGEGRPRRRRRRCADRQAEAANDADVAADKGENFGYTTETIYPDLNGFARAFDQFAPMG